MSQTLRDEIAEALELQKGGIDAPKTAPAQDHYYFYNQVIDYESEKLIMEQWLNFEEKIDSVMALIQSERREAIDEFQQWYNFESGIDHHITDFSVKSFLAELTPEEGKEY